MTLSAFQKPKTVETEQHLRVQILVKRLVETMKQMTPEDLAEHVDRLDKAKTLGPVFDPVLWAANKNAVLFEGYVCERVIAFLAEVTAEAARLGSEPEIKV